MVRRFPAALAAFLLAGPTFAAPPGATIEEIAIAPIALATATFPSGKIMPLTVGLGSGAYAMPGQPDHIWTITDRGPNIDCAQAKKYTGSDTNAMCGGDKSAKIFPVPGFTPTIYEIVIDGKTARVASAIKLRKSDGTPITGISNPLKGARTEAAYGADGKPLPFDPSGVDSEALVRLPDGSFWIGEEYGSSILHVAPDGKILERKVPKGLETDYKDAGYPVAGTLPAIIAKRELNRGIENLTVSPDGRFLYVMMQNPLANPDSKTYRESGNTRLWKIDRASGKVVAEYLYPMDDPATFRSDKTSKPRRQNAVRMSEMAAVGPDRLLVLERINKTTKLYLVDLAAAAPIPARLDDPATRPSLEQIAPEGFAAAGIEPLAKTLVFDSDDHPGALPAKIEGVAVLDPRTLILVNDNDFGIGEDKTRMFRVRFSKDILH